jgi:hypothetical protein
VVIVSQRIALALLTVILIVAGLAVAIASSAPTSTGQINVTATLIKATGRQVGKPGRQSNALEQSWRITDRNGTTIGRMLQQCRWITRNARLCSGELNLTRGKLTYLGSSPTAFEGEYAVTGGTGTYRSAGGVMLFTAIGLRKTVLLITVEG